MHPINRNEFLKTVIACTLNRKISDFFQFFYENSEITQLKVHAITVFRKFVSIDGVHAL